jgi:hypothetical protein
MQSDMHVPQPAFASESKRIWEEIARELAAQQDPVKMVLLWQELDKAMATEKRTLIYRSPHPSRLSLTLIP